MEARKIVILWVSENKYIVHKYIFKWNKSSNAFVKDIITIIQKKNSWHWNYQFAIILTSVEHGLMKKINVLILAVNKLVYQLKLNKYKLVYAILVILKK